MADCQNCGHTLTDTSATLCRDCRHQYARTLNQLRGTLTLLDAMARREYRLSQHANHTGGKATGTASTPLLLPLADLLDQAEDQLQDTAVDAGFTWLDTWRRLIPRMLTRLDQLCHAPHAASHLRRLTHTLARLTPIVDRVPRTRRIIGHCPSCGGEIEATKGEQWRICETCDTLVDVNEAKAAATKALDKCHLTRTPAGLAQWLKDEYGYQISRKTILMWIRRGKLPSTKPIEDSEGYYEFSIVEVLPLAMAAATRRKTQQ